MLDLSTRERRLAHADALLAAYHYHDAQARKHAARANTLYGLIIGLGIAALPLALILPGFLPV